MSPEPFSDETVVLSNGIELRLRAVRPTDKPLLVEGFEELSPRSRYLRFLAAKPRLNDDELRYLTELDGDKHVALGATRLRDDGSEEPVGIARFVANRDDAELAEAAVTVKDAYHHMGVGKLLLRRLAGVAAAHGVRRFRCTVLADNAAMLSLLTDLDPKAHVVRTASGAAEIELKVPQPELTVEAEEHHRTLERFLAHVARQWSAMRKGGDPEGS